MAVAVIVAAGRGERLGFGRPKALVTLAGRSLLQWSVDALRGVDAVQRIVVALPPDSLAAAPAETVAIAGGDSRSQSVRQALRAAGVGDPVIVHDAARPLCTPALFALTLEELERSGADGVVAAMPVSDTIKEVATDGSTVARTLERGRLWAVQTPQAFRRAPLEAALEGASEDVIATATDDAWLIERAGGTVRVVRAEAGNIKITTAADLLVAERLLAERAR